LQRKADQMRAGVRNNAADVVARIFDEIADEILALRIKDSAVTADKGA